MSQRSDGGETVVVVNPNSGSGDHVPDVRERAARLGYVVRTSERPGHAGDLATQAATDGAERVVAAGGDGTLNEVVRGVDGAKALEDVTIGVIPCGTGNNFSTNVGIDTVPAAFDALERGAPRLLDLGRANGRPFVNSCVGGLTADASARTDSATKERLGVLAYVLATLRTVTDFDGLALTVEVGDGGESEPVWSGHAACILVGNARRFSVHGSEQAHLEDGCFDVTVVEQTTTLELAGERLRERLLEVEAEHLTRLLASSLRLTVRGRDRVTFSLDGEMKSFRSLDLTTDHRALRFLVGDGYEPSPDRNS